MARFGEIIILRNTRLLQRHWPNFRFDSWRKDHLRHQELRCKGLKMSLREPREADAWAGDHRDNNMPRPRSPTHRDATIFRREKSMAGS